MCPYWKTSLYESLMMKMTILTILCCSDDDGNEYELQRWWKIFTNIAMLVKKPNHNIFEFAFIQTFLVVST